MKDDEFSDMGSVKALLADARERIKEAEDRSKQKIEEVEQRVNATVKDIYEAIDEINKFKNEYLPLLKNLTTSENSRRTLTLVLVGSFISTVAAWILAIFVYFVKSGVIK